MNESTHQTISINQDLQNGFNSHNRLCKLAYELQNTTSTRITIDLSKTNFIAANLFPVLGCIFSEFNAKAPGNAIGIANMKDSILDTAQKNGFCIHFGMKKIPDVNNTVIPYKKFLVDEIAEYERYLTLNLFTRNDLPKMSKEASDSIRDSLLELFKNVKDHTTSEYIYTCGHYFPKSYMLYFTIVDIGETIPYNVNRYHKAHNFPIPEQALPWAITSGNSTSISQSPRGIGFTLIEEFVNLNKGDFYIVSEQETFEINHGKKRFQKLDYPFPGTIVTVGFNLHDDATYILTSEKNNTIQF